MGGRFEIQFHSNYRKNAPFFCKLGYKKTVSAKKLCSSPFHVFDVICVIYNPGCIRVLIIDPDIHRLAQPQIDRLDCAALSVF